MSFSLAYFARPIIINKISLSAMIGTRSRNVPTMALATALIAMFSMIRVTASTACFSHSTITHSPSILSVHRSLPLPFQSRRNLSHPNRFLPHTTRKKSNLICFYVEEWADANIKLSFNNNNWSSSSVLPQRPASFFNQFLLQFARIFKSFKEFFRSRIERCTVYVLELENGKYYVGSTTNRKRRIKQHNTRRGSKWTREHKPIRVLREYRRIPSKYLLGMESQITAECMLEFGINNVRGSMFSTPRDYHLGDIDALTRFLGHYNDLSYRKVQGRLSQTLPNGPRYRISSGSNGKCFSCGKHGHFAAECPERELNS